MTRLAVCAAALAAGFVVVAAGDNPKPQPQPQPKPPITLKAPPKAMVVPKTDPAEAEALATVLRDLLKKHLPDPISKSSQNWGNQKAVTVVHRHREGFRFWSESVQEMRNDGVWRRIAVRIPDPSKITLAVLELTHPKEGKLNATIGVIAERVEVKFEQQIWRNGLRLYAGETRGHAKGELLIKAEATTKTEFKPGALLPEVTVIVRATEAHIGYGEIVIDHTAGLDGEAAKLLGEVAIKAVKTFKPDLEGELLQKGNAAIVKAAGTREFRVALDKLLQTRKK